jgi:hypothetical protein
LYALHYVHLATHACLPARLMQGTNSAPGAQPSFDVTAPLLFMYGGSELRSSGSRPAASSSADSGSAPSSLEGQLASAFGWVAWCCLAAHSTCARAVSHTCGVRRHACRDAESATSWQEQHLQEQRVPMSPMLHRLLGPCYPQLTHSTVTLGDCVSCGHLEMPSPPVEPELLRHHLLSLSCSVTTC